MLDVLIAVVTAFGLGNISGSIATHFLGRRAEEQKRRIATDRATYERRSTVLISTTLTALIRSNRCRENERNELAELIQNLGAGDQRGDFLDPGVRRAWIRFLEQSAACGWKRLAEAITELDIHTYSKARQEWENAARKSFGPLPEIGDSPPMRQGDRRGDGWHEGAAKPRPGDGSKERRAVKE